MLAVIFVTKGHKKAMSESFIQILLFLFKRYLATELVQPSDPDGLRAELSNAGFSDHSAKEVIDWLSDTTKNKTEIEQQQSASFRVFTAAECVKLNAKVRGFLVFLEQYGVLDAVSRECIIERAMALNENTVSLTELEFLIRLFLLNDGPQTEAEKQLYELVFTEGTMH